MASVILHADFDSCEQQVAAQPPLTGFGISLLLSVCNQDCSGFADVDGGGGVGGGGGPGGFGGCWSSNRKGLGGAEGDFFILATHPR